MAEVFLAVFPVFLILGVGMVLDRSRLLAENFAGQLSLYVFNLAMPCLLFRLVAVSGLSFSRMGGYLLGMFLAQTLVFWAGYAWMTAGFRRPSLEAAIVALAFGCSNSGFIGLPVVDSLLPGNKEALVAVGLACTLTPLTLISAQALIESRTRAAGGAMPKIVARAVLLNPFLLATVSGFVCNLSGTGIWAPADRVLALLGSTAAPCALVALGLDMRRKLAVAGRAASPHRLKWQSGIAAARLAGHPLAAWIIMAALGVPDIWLAAGVLTSGTSTAVMTYVLADISGVIPEESALSVVITAALSMATIPAFALALRAAGYM